MTTRGTFPDAHFHNMTLDGDVTVSSSTTNKPLFTLKNTNDGGTGAILKFDNTEASGAGADDDVLGSISFNGQDSASATEEYVLITAKAEETTAGSEQGRLDIGCSVNADGEVDTIFTLCGGDAVGTSALGAHSMLQLKGGFIRGQDIVINTSGGAATITAQQLLAGYYFYTGAAGGGVALNLPGVTATLAALALVGIVPQAGQLICTIVVDVTDSNNLTVTAGTGNETLVGTTAINNKTATIYYVFTSATAASAIICNHN